MSNPRIWYTLKAIRRYSCRTNKSYDFVWLVLSQWSEEMRHVLFKVTGGMLPNVGGVDPFNTTLRGRRATRGVTVL